MKMDNGQRTQTHVAETRSLFRRADSPTLLESWKDIAAYFKRSVRTVQRWEVFEGMPVHRHQHTNGGSAFAYLHELDAWRARRSQQGRGISAAPIYRAAIATVLLENQAALRTLLEELLQQLGETPTPPAFKAMHETTLPQDTGGEELASRTDSGNAGDQINGNHIQTHSFLPSLQ